LAKERTSSRSPRRILLIGVGSVVLLGIGAAVLLTRDDASERTLRPDGDATSPSVAVADTPAFRFTKVTRDLLRTSPGRIKGRQRREIVRAASAAREVVADLYTEGFLDPANWEHGLYAEAFRGFAGGARKRATERTALLTAGPRAGDRYERILPVSGHLATRILLDRLGHPTLVVSVVRFSAAALGSEPVTFRSTGQFFFESVGASWKIVSFHVKRNDTPREAA
jgi:hypothetical protein